jgi:ribosomal-protein-alanine N-acetyltransferase
MAQMNMQVFGGGTRGFALLEMGELRSKTIVLRPLTPADYLDYKAVVERNADRLAPAAASREAVMAIVESPEMFEANWHISEAARSIGTDFSFGVFEGDEIIGEVGLAGVRRGAFNSAFETAWIDKDHLGQNKFQEAIVLVFRFAFEDLGLNRVECAVEPDNEPMQHALKKLGIEAEGLARDYMFVGGEFRDHLRFVITAADWTERGPELLAEWAGI